MSRCSFQATYVSRNGGYSTTQPSAAVSTGFYPDGLGPRWIYVTIYRGGNREAGSFDIAAFC